MRQDPIDTEKKQISGYDMKQVLRICGHTLKSFTEELDKSYQWARTTLAEKKQIPFKYYDELINFVGEDNFELAIDRIEEKRSEWNKRREKTT